MEHRSWRDSFTRPTRQYVAGILAGGGVGIVTGSWLSLGWHPFVVIPGFGLAAVGSYLARADQRRRQGHESVGA